MRACRAAPPTRGRGRTPDLSRTRSGRTAPARESGERRDSRRTGHVHGPRTTGRPARSRRPWPSRTSRRTPDSRRSPMPRSTVVRSFEVTARPLDLARSRAPGTFARRSCTAGSAGGSPAAGACSTGGTRRWSPGARIIGAPLQPAGGPVRDDGVLGDHEATGRTVSDRARRTAGRRGRSPCIGLISSPRDTHAVSRRGGTPSAMRHGPGERTVDRNGGIGPQKGGGIGVHGVQECPLSSPLNQRPRMPVDNRGRD